jgi:hypothetical protein
MTSHARSGPTGFATGEVGAPRVTDCSSMAIETIRVIVVAGIPYGAIVVGVGSRLAMLLLRVTSPHRVIGTRSDDDFVIGRFTLAGTYNLLILGAAVGVIGAGTYLLVASRLLGPAWFRYLTVGLASAAVVGSMLVHPNGVDFTRLQPTWLAIGVFVALPGLFGTLIGPTVDAVRRADSWTSRGRRRWLIPIAAVMCFPPTILVVVVAVVGVAVLTTVGSNTILREIRSTRACGVIVQAAWLAIAMAGLAALISDIRQLT